MSKCTIIEKLLEEMQQNMIMAGIKEINYIKTIKPKQEKKTFYGLRLTWHTELI